MTGEWVGLEKGRADREQRWSNIVDPSLSLSHTMRTSAQGQRRRRSAAAVPGGISHSGIVLIMTDL